MLNYESYKVKVKVNAYEDNKGLYVGLDYFDEELECVLPFSNITVNIEDSKFNYLEAAIDTNNLGDYVLLFLEENGLAVDTGKKVYSGFCKYPVYKFLEDRLFELCPMDFARYKRILKRGN